MRGDGKVAGPGIAWTLALFVLLLSSCFYFYHQEKSETRTWAAAGINLLRAHTPIGEVTVTAATDTVIRADIVRQASGFDKPDAEEALARIAVSDSISGGALFLQAEIPKPNNRSCAAAFSIAAPSSIELDVSTSNGALAVSGMTAGGRVAADNGSITLTGTADPLAVAAANGKVTVSNHQGSIGILADNGAIDCDVASFSGDDTADVNAANGAAFLRLPASVSARFDITAPNGSVIVAGFPDVNFTLNEPKHKTGTIGSGEAMVIVFSGNGQARLLAR
jgi:hypothetical protein